MPRNPKSRMLEALVERLGDGVIGVDRHGLVLIINREAAQLLGVTESQVYRQPIWQLAAAAELSRHLRPLLNDAEASFREKVILFPDGRVILTQMVPVRDNQDRIGGVVTILKDITAISDIDNTLGQFVANVSHELKTPLTAIKGFVETLLEGAYQEPEVSRRFLKVINDETNRMTRLIMGLLDISSMGARQEEIRLNPLPIGEILERATATLRPVADSKGLEMKSSIPADLPQVMGDPDRLMQVVMNLLDNAIKYTGIHGKGRVELSAHTEAGQVVVAVSDSGIGIGAEDRERIFERFYRVRTGPSAELGGTGLGLSITKEIVEAHGGSISVRSKAGQGSTFTFRLPEAPATEQEGD